VIAPISPQRSALLLLDLQNAVLPTVTEPAALIGRAVAALVVARQAAVAVGFIRVGLTVAERTAVPASNRTFSRIAAMDFLAAGTPATEMPNSIMPVAGDLVFTKTRVGAFSTTDLHKGLQDKGIDTIILGGIHTSGVVLSTVRHAADLDYRVLVVENLCADPRADVHHFLIEQVFPAQAEVIQLEELEHLLA
jgi:nicotinamidase-related amidase